MAEGKMSTRQNKMIVSGRATATSASYILISKVLSFVINGIALVFIARILAPEEYGIYIVAMAVAGFFGAFGDFGISSALAKLSAEYMAKKDIAKASDVVGSGLALLIILPGVCALLAILLSGPIATYILKNPTYTFPLQLAAITIVATVLYGAFYAALIGFGKAKRIAQTTFVQSTLQACISVGLALMGFGAVAPIYGISISFFIGFGIMLAILIVECKVKLTPSVLGMEKLRKVFKFSIPLGISSAAHTIIINTAIIVLGIVATTQVVGNFGIATRVSGTFDIIVGTIGLSLLPLFSATFTEKMGKKLLASYFNYSIYIAFLLIAPVSFYMVVLAKQFTYTIFSGLYSIAPLYIAIMAVGILLSITSTYATTLVVGTGDTKKVLKYGLIVVIVDILLIPPLLLLLGGLGLSLIVFIIEPIVANLLYLRILKERLGLRIKTNKIIRVVVAAMISAAFILPLVLVAQTYYIQVLIAAAIEQTILYPLIVSLLGGVTQKDIVSLKEVSGGLPVISQIIGILCSYMKIVAREG